MYGSKADTDEQKMIIRSVFPKWLDAGWRSLGDGQDYARNDYEDDESGPKKRRNKKIENKCENE